MVFGIIGDGAHINFWKKVVDWLRELKEVWQ